MKMYRINSIGGEVYHVDAPAMDKVFTFALDCKEVSKTELQNGDILITPIEPMFNGQYFGFTHSETKNPGDPSLPGRFFGHGIIIGKLDEDGKHTEPVTTHPDCLATIRFWYTERDAKGYPIIQDVREGVKPMPIRRPSDIKPVEQPAANAEGVLITVPSSVTEEPIVMTDVDTPADTGVVSDEPQESEEGNAEALGNNGDELLKEDVSAITEEQLGGTR